MWNNSINNVSIHRILRRHNTYINTYDLEACFMSTELAKTHEVACGFVKQTAGCSDLTKRNNYLQFLVCTAKVNPDSLGLFEMCLFFLSILLISTAFLFLVTKHFILPNLMHVCTYIHMPLYDFGVAVIAVIMSGPQVGWIFHDCSNVTKSNSLILANMIGRTFSTFTVGLSVACFGQHTKLPNGEIVKHIGFATAIVTLTYLMVKSRLEANFVQGKSEFVSDLRPMALFLVILYVSFLTYTIMTKRRRTRHSSVHKRLHHQVVMIESNKGWPQLWHALNPFEHMDLPKYMIAVFTPIWILAALQVPVIDKERHNYGWCKYLACVNILIFPWIMWYANVNTSPLIFGTVFFFCMIILAITIMCTSVTEPPKYQGFYAVTGILFGFYSYYVVQEELETILWQSFSFIFNMPRDIIMLIGYVFHNILNLVIFCYELVDTGYANLACGVVMGIVLNQVFLMLPIITFHRCFDQQSLVAVSANSTTCFVFLIMAFFLTLLSLTTTNFKLRVSQGAYLIMFYGIFLLFVILAGMLVIHPYGGFHSVALGFKKEGNSWA